MTVAVKKWQLEQQLNGLEAKYCWGRDCQEYSCENCCIEVEDAEVEE